MYEYSLTDELYRMLHFTVGLNSICFHWGSKKGF